MLEIKNLQVSYGAINALHGISLSVKAGSIVTLIGANGAGKTTTLKTISGLLKPRAGEIFYDGKTISGLPPHQIVKLGLSHVCRNAGSRSPGRCPAANSRCWRLAAR